MRDRSKDQQEQPEDRPPLHPEDIRKMVEQGEEDWRERSSREEAENARHTERLENKRRDLALKRERFQMPAEFALIAIITAIVIYLLLLHQFTAAAALGGSSFSGAVVGLFKRSQSGD